MKDGPIKVLLVKDNPDDVEFIGEFIGAAGNAYDIVATDTLSSAMEAVQEQTFDVVLLDLGLPDSLGVQTLQRIRSLEAPPPMVILIQGLSGQEKSMTASQFGLEPLRQGNADVFKSLVQSYGDQLELQLERRSHGGAEQTYPIVVRMADRLGELRRPAGRAGRARADGAAGVHRRRHQAGRRLHGRSAVPCHPFARTLVNCYRTHASS